MRRSRTVPVDTGNAHIRRRPETKRQSPEIAANEAQRLLDDPAFERAFETVHESIVNAIIYSKRDGTQADADEFERECCRTLRNLHSIKRTVTMAVQGQRLKLADFKPVESQQADKTV